MITPWSEQLIFGYIHVRNMIIMDSVRNLDRDKTKIFKKSFTESTEAGISGPCFKSRFEN